MSNTTNESRRPHGGSASSILTSRDRDEIETLLAKRVPRLDADAAASRRVNQYFVRE